MIDRRRIFTAGLLAAAATATATTALASRTVVAKDQAGYAAVIDRLFAAWWDRDFTAFQAVFADPDVSKPFDGRPLFEAHYAKRAKRFRGQLLFNGAMVVAQVVTPNLEGYPEAGIEGGFAMGELFQVRFFPGLEKPVIASLAYLGEDALARSEWIALPNAPGL